MPRNGEFISLGSAATSASDPSHAASFATDGGMQTYWEAAEGDTLATLTIPLDATKQFDKISIFECCDIVKSDDMFSNIRLNRIRQYSVDMLQEGRWTTIYCSDEPMGDCKVIRLPQKYSASQIRLRVQKATAPPAIYEFNVIDR